ncbi:MAG: DUF983 domain-containing protein [Cyclobacteriaceae bacterium]
MSEKGLFQAILECKCPQCREGSMFTNRAYDLRRFGKMPENCPKCDFRFEKEPGFFYGAMYISYGLSVAIFLVTVFSLMIFGGDLPLITYILAVSGVAILLYPLNFRYSRVIFVNIFGGAKYNSNGTAPKSVS